MEDFLVDIPAPISLKVPLFGLDFHPNRNLVACSSASGAVQLLEYQPNGPNKVLRNLTHHTKSCRSVLFSKGDGANLFSCSSDKSIVGIDIETGKTVFEQSKAHKSAIEAMLLHENLIFTGDESGVVKVWDQRKPDKVREIPENEDLITSFVVNPDRNALLATSGDQTLTVIDYGSGKALDRSVEQEDELLSMALIKGGSKIVCGGQTGLLSIFTWDQWADRSAAFPAHLESVDCILPIDDDTIITGCGDGIISIVSIQPNKILGVVSAHSEELPITSLALSHDKKYLAACIDSTVQFWNVSMLYEEDDSEDEGAGEEDVVEEDGGAMMGEDDEEDGDMVDGEEDDVEEEEELSSSPDFSDDSSSEESSSNDKKPIFRGAPPPKKGRRTADPSQAAFFGDL